MSFSYLSWRSMELLECGQIDIQDLDVETIRQILYTILPGGQTFLHKLYNSPEIVE